MKLTKEQFKEFIKESINEATLPPKLPKNFVLYRVKDGVSDYSTGDIIIAYLLVNDGNTALLYHPKENISGTVPSIELCKKIVSKHGYLYVPVNDSSYINIYDISEEMKILKNSIQAKTRELFPNGLLFEKKK